MIGGGADPVEVSQAWSSQISGNAPVPRFDMGNQVQLPEHGELPAEGGVPEQVQPSVRMKYRVVDYQ